MAFGRNNIHTIIIYTSDLYDTHGHAISREPKVFRDRIIARDDVYFLISVTLRLFYEYRFLKNNNIISVASHAPASNIMLILRIRID